MKHVGITETMATTGITGNRTRVTIGRAAQSGYGQSMATIASVVATNSIRAFELKSGRRKMVGLFYFLHDDTSSSILGRALS